MTTAVTRGPATPGAAPDGLGLSLSELHKVYRRRGQPDVAAVRGIDLRVRRGELLALLGPSGCGKTSTLRMVAGLEAVTRGDIQIDGRSVAALPPHRRNVGVAFENYALYPPLTVAENISFGLKARREHDVAARVREIAARLDLTDILSAKPGALSSGQKQRVSLARAIARRPSVLLLDEPLSHLDAAQREHTRRELKRLQRETGYTTVLVTHDQLEALSMADRLAVMNEGEIHQVGTPEEVYDDPANLFVAEFVGEPAMNLLPVRARPGTAELAPGVEIGTGVQNVPDGRDAMLGVRPEDVRLAGPDDPGTLGATVVVFEPLLETGLATVGLPGVDRHLVVQTDPGERLAGGRPVRLAFDRVLLFDANTGGRIR